MELTCPLSSPPSRCSKVAFKGILRSPTKKSFFEVGVVSLASQSRRRLEGQGSGTVGGGGVEDRISCPLFIASSTLSSSDFSSQLFPILHQEKALHGEVLALLTKGAIKLAPSSLGYYSRLFVVWKALGSWRPVIDLSWLNKFVLQIRFKMESSQSVLRAIWRGGWMVSVDLKDAYLQVPVHPNSCKFFRFVVDETVYQFKAFRFSLSTAPQVFTSFLAPVSVMLHDLSVRILRHLDDWLLRASSRAETLWARDKVLTLCHRLGNVLNLEK